jgi:hypothetical protein
MPSVIEIGFNAAGGAARNSATQAAMSIDVVAMAFRPSQDHRTTLLPRAALDCQRHLHANRLSMQARQASPDLNRQRGTGTIPIAPDHQQRLVQSGFYEVASMPALLASPPGRSAPEAFWIGRA